MKKRCLSILMVLSMVLSILPIESFAASNTDVTYAVDGGNIHFDTTTGTITDCDYWVTNANIPNTINGVDVEHIGGNAFNQCFYLESITIPESVKTIGGNAFSLSDKLTSIVIPDSVVSVGSQAFYNCTSLESVILSKNLTCIESSTFSGCKQLGSIKIPDRVTSIGESAFDRCEALTSIEIPTSVVQIENSAFMKCSNLKNVVLPQKLSAIADFTFYGCSSLTNVVIPTNVLSIGGDAFGGCSGLEQINIPDGVVSIGSSAFYGCSSLKSIVIPDSVTSLGNAFSNCSSLISVTIHASLDSRIFLNCPAITHVRLTGAKPMYDYSGTYPYETSKPWIGCANNVTVEIENSVPYIGSYAFYGCDKLTEITIPNSTTTIGKAAFKNCIALKKVIIPSNVTSFETDASGRGVFSGCTELKTAGPIGGDYNIQFAWTDKIPDNAFDQAEIESVLIPDSIITIGDAAFQSCGNLRDITFGKNITTIGARAFEGCNAITYVSLSNNVTKVEECAFRSCTGLTGIFLPKSILEIEQSSFDSCASLSDVYYDGSEEEWALIGGNGKPSDKTVTIHYNSTGPDDVGPDNMNPVYFLSSWDATTRTVQFGDNTLTSSDKYTVADSVDVSNISSLLNKYVLVAMEQGNSSLEYTITDIQLVESRIGTVSTTGEHSMTIDGTTYPVREDFLLASLDGEEVLYHVSNGSIVGFDVLEEKHGVLGSWNEATKKITIGGTEYPTNYMTDLSFMDNIRDYFQKNVTFLVANSSGYCPMIRVTGLYSSGNVNGFNADVYHANWLSQDTTSAIKLNEKTPSDILSEQLTNHGMESATVMWKSLQAIFNTLEDPTSIKDFAFEKKDMYSAIILDALEASISYDTIDSFVEEYYDQLGSLFETVSKAIQHQHNIDITKPGEFIRMTSQQRADVQEETKKWFEKELPELTIANSVFDGISMGFDSIESLENYGERIASTLLLANTNESMKAVIRQAYQNSRSTNNIDLQLALNDCVQIMDASTEELCQRLVAGEVTVLGSKALKYLIKEQFWGQVTKMLNQIAPEVAILKDVYKIESFLCDRLTNASSAIEQYLKMLSTLDIENLMNGVYNDLRQSFLNEKEPQQALVYLEAMRLMFKLRSVDCESAVDYIDVIYTEDVDIFDDSLLLIIKRLFGAKDTDDIQALKGSIQNIQSYYNDVYIDTEKGWIYWLENDFPGTGLYEKYLKFYESGGNASLVKEYKAACPVDVYVYDQSNTIVASVIDGRVSCSVDDVMIALVDDQKVIRFYDGADYRIEYVGNDTGDMDVTITEFDENEKTTRTVNYYNLALTNGKTYTIGADDDTLKPYNFTDKSDNSTVQHDYDSMDTNAAHTIKIVSGTLQQGEELFTETTASKGETLQLNAYVPEGYEFVRWESSSTNALIADINSVNTTLIMPDEDLTITAIMRDTHSPSTAHTVRFDPNGGTLSGSATLVTSTSGKLSNLPTATRSNYTFDGWYTEISGGDKVTVNYVFTSDATVYAHWTKNSGGSSGGSSSGGGSSGGSSTYPPTVSKPSEGGGAATVSPTNPKQGDTVTVTPKPDEGYEVDKITVTGPNGKTVEVKHNPGGTYTFIQPNGKVKIEVTYKLIDGSWGNPFTDVSEGSWYYAAVRFVQENGLMGGYGNGRFGPNDNLSRAQLAQILFNREGRPVVNYLMQFGDVTDEAWYAEAVRWAASQGIVSGYGNGMFGPNDPITREQLAVMLWRYSGSPAATNKELHFNDTDEISGFALEAMRWAVEHGIVNGYGDGRLGPKGQATRAQVAQMLKNYLER